VVSLDTIREAMRDHRAEVIEDPGIPRAAVAMVFREGPGATELLFIERAQREDDPWSGHMAFPGGRVEPVDPGTRAAALRETHEEVGLSLYQSEPLGRLDDQRGNRGGQQLSLVISPFLYHLEEEQPLRINHEVASALWVPLPRLLDTDNHVTYPHRPGNFPGIQVGDPDRHVVWGLTYRFLRIFFDLLGHSLPERRKAG
jgi:8-oxo-dGTP pyrophosphatase MutT (NUDIX family)